MQWLCSLTLWCGQTQQDKLPDQGLIVTPEDVSLADVKSKEATRSSSATARIRQKTSLSHASANGPEHLGADGG